MGRGVKVYGVKLSHRENRRLRTQREGVKKGPKIARRTLIVLTAVVSSPK